MDQSQAMKQISALMETLQVFPKRLSEKSGVPVNTIHNMKRGKQYNSYESMERVANALGYEFVLTFKRN